MSLADGHPDTPEGFDYLSAYSPVHNVNGEKTYPPVMLLTGDHDDRVVPLHSFKFAAALQHALPKNPNRASSCSRPCGIWLKSAQLFCSGST